MLKVNHPKKKSLDSTEQIAFTLRRAVGSSQPDSYLIRGNKLMKFPDILDQAVRGAQGNLPYRAGMEPLLTSPSVATAPREPSVTPLNMRVLLDRSDSMGYIATAQGITVLDHL